MIFERHSLALRWILYGLSVVMLVALVGSMGYFWSQHDKASNKLAKLQDSVADDPSWGFSQLNFEWIRLRAALHEWVMNPHDETARLSLRQDILYSRFQVVSEVMARLEASNADREGGTYKLPVEIQDDFNRLIHVYTVLDERITAIRLSGNTDGLSEVLDTMRAFEKVTAGLASRSNHWMLEEDRNTRQLVAEQLDINKSFLVVMAFSLVLYISFVLLFFLIMLQSNRQLAVERARAETADRAKSEFLSSMSHELRTPMNAILGFGQLLQYDQVEPLSEDQKENVSEILIAGNHLMSLIDEVLDLSKIESGALTVSIEPVNLHELCHECVRLVAQQASQRNLTVETRFQARANVMADYTRLKQVLLNLLSNAVKYNRDHGEVTIATSDLPSGRVRISVSDTGVGISEALYQRVFKPFERLGMETGAIEGTGIGLTITRRLVDMMGGVIDFASEVGRGSSFWIELPAYTDLSEPDPESPQLTALLRE